jgi:splicing factor 3B subunit 3
MIPLDGNEAAFSAAVVPFVQRDGELHLVVGTAADTFLSPRSCASGYLRTYRIIEEGRGLELLHKVSRPSLYLFRTQLTVSFALDRMR